jgi:4-hydroxy-4-methyl-2-oxoglutarate aldolase
VTGPSSAASLASGSPGLVRVIAGLYPVRRGLKLWGTAFTVRGTSGDNLALHRALAASEPGDVIVAEITGDVPRGHWGELMTIAASAAGVAGLIIDGTIRDREALAASGFPVFHRGSNPLPAAKDVPGELQIPVEIAGVEVRPGDGVYADDDGIVVVPGSHVVAAVAASRAVDAYERPIAARLAAGERTIDVLGLGE